jgi:hypothetical protein
MNSLFCRHNRFTADCPICSKDTVLDTQRRPARGQAARPRRGRATPAAGGARFTGPYASVGPYEDGDDARYEVRLERVPGGLRLAEWAGGALRRRAPALPPADVARLIGAAAERGVLGGRELQALEEALGAPRSDGDATFGASRGRSGDMSEELRVERVGAAEVRIGRWTLRPGDGWLLHDAPIMLPAARYAEALGAAVRAGVLADAS